MLNKRKQQPNQNIKSDTPKKKMRNPKGTYVYVDTQTPTYHEKVTPEDEANIKEVPTRIDQKQLFVNGREIATLYTLRARAYREKKRKEELRKKSQPTDASPKKQIFLDKAIYYSVPDITGIHQEVPKKLTPKNRFNNARNVHWVCPLRSSRGF